MAGYRSRYTSRTLKPWIVSKICSDTQPTRCIPRSVKIMETVKGSSNGCHKHVTDGEVFIKCWFTDGAVKYFYEALDGECTTDSDWSSALVILQEFTLEFYAHSVLGGCGFYLKVKKFILWDLQQSFERKNTLTYCLSIPKVRNKIEEMWKHWKNKPPPDNNNGNHCYTQADASCDLSHLIYLAEEEDQHEEQTANSESKDSDDEEDQRVLGLRKLLCEPFSVEEFLIDKSDSQKQHDEDRESQGQIPDDMSAVARGDDLAPLSAQDTAGDDPAVTIDTPLHKDDVTELTTKTSLPTCAQRDQNGNEIPYSQSSVWLDQVDSIEITYSDESLDFGPPSEHSTQAPPVNRHRQLPRLGISKGDNQSPTSPDPSPIVISSDSNSRLSEEKTQSPETDVTPRDADQIPCGQRSTSVDSAVTPIDNSETSLLDVVSSQNNRQNSDVEMQESSGKSDESVSVLRSRSQYTCLRKNKNGLAECPATFDVTHSDRILTKQDSLPTGEKEDKKQLHLKKMSYVSDLNKKESNTSTMNIDNIGLIRHPKLKGNDSSSRSASLQTDKSEQTGSITVTPGRVDHPTSSSGVENSDNQLLNSSEKDGKTVTGTSKFESSNVILISSSGSSSSGCVDSTHSSIPKPTEILCLSEDSIRPTDSDPIRPGGTIASDSPVCNLADNNLSSNDRPMSSSGTDSYLISPSPDANTSTFHPFFSLSAPRPSIADKNTVIEPGIHVTENCTSGILSKATDVTSTCPTIYLLTASSSSAIVVPSKRSITSSEMPQSDKTAMPSTSSSDMDVPSKKSKIVTEVGQSVTSFVTETTENELYKDKFTSIKETKESTAFSDALQNTSAKEISKVDRGGKTKEWNSSENTNVPEKTVCLNSPTEVGCDRDIESASHCENSDIGKDQMPNKSSEKLKQNYTLIPLIGSHVGRQKVQREELSSASFKLGPPVALTSQQSASSIDTRRMSVRVKQRNDEKVLEKDKRQTLTTVGNLKRQTAERQIAKRQIAEIQTTERQTAKRHTGERQIAEIQTAERQSLGKQTVEKQTVERQTVERQTVERQTRQEQEGEAQTALLEIIRLKSERLITFRACDDVAVNKDRTVSCSVKESQNKACESAVTSTRSTTNLVGNMNLSTTRNHDDQQDFQAVYKKFTVNHVHNKDCDVQSLGGSSTYSLGESSTHSLGGSSTHSLGGSSTHSFGGSSTHSLGGSSTHSLGGSSTHSFGGSSTHSLGGSSTLNYSDGCDNVSRNTKVRRKELNIEKGDLSGSSELTIDSEGIGHGQKDKKQKLDHKESHSDRSSEYPETQCFQTVLPVTEEIMEEDTEISASLGFDVPEEPHLNEGQPAVGATRQKSEGLCNDTMMNVSVQRKEDIVLPQPVVEREAQQSISDDGTRNRRSPYKCLTEKIMEDSLETGLECQQSNVTEGDNRILKRKKLENKNSNEKETSEFAHATLAPITNRPDSKLYIPLGSQDLMMKFTSQELPRFVRNGKKDTTESHSHSARQFSNKNQEIWVSVDNKEKKIDNPIIIDSSSEETSQRWQDKLPGQLQSSKLSEQSQASKLAEQSQSTKIKITQTLDGQMICSSVPPGKTKPHTGNLCETQSLKNSNSTPVSQEVIKVFELSSSEDSNEAVVSLSIPCHADEQKKACSKDSDRQRWLQFLSDIPEQAVSVQSIQLHNLVLPDKLSVMVDKFVSKQFNTQLH